MNQLVESKFADLIHDYHERKVNVELVAQILDVKPEYVKFQYDLINDSKREANNLTLGYQDGKTMILNRLKEIAKIESELFDAIEKQKKNGSTYKTTAAILELQYKYSTYRVY